MLKYRLIFGTLMIIFIVALGLLDGYLDGSLTTSADDKPIQATIFCALVALMAIPASLEMASLIRKTGAHIFKPITILASILLATAWYWRQFCPNPFQFHLYYLLFVSAFSLIALFICQAVQFGTVGVIANCAATYFSIFYLGLLSSFVLAMRIDFGLWPLFMFIFTVKASDIGAYTIGRLLGKHKLSPKISPSKTWEGLAGAVFFAAIVAFAISTCCGIMKWQMAVLFGAIFAVLGQLADLTESMIKRDAEQKDSDNTVPGFGGVLDVIDSLLVSAPVAYLFFMITLGL